MHGSGSAGGESGGEATSGRAAPAHDRHSALTVRSKRPGFEMVYWLLFLTFALVVAGLLAFGGAAVESRGAARLSFFVLALLLVISLAAALMRSRRGSKRPPGPDES